MGRYVEGEWEEAPSKTKIPKRKPHLRVKSEVEVLVPPRRQKPLGTEKLDVRWYVCQRKKRYKSVAKARQAARTFGGGMEYYECTNCHGWHIGRRHGEGSTA